MGCWARSTAPISMRFSDMIILFFNFRFKQVLEKAFSQSFHLQNTLLNRVSGIFFIYFISSIFESIWKGGSTKRALGAYCTRKISVLFEQESVFYAVVFQLEYQNIYSTFWITYTSYIAVNLCVITAKLTFEMICLLVLTHTWQQCAAPWCRVLASLFEMKILPM